MSLSQASQHGQYWTDLLRDLEGISWSTIISILMNTDHGFSNYEKCKRRDHGQVRQDVFDDQKVRDFAASSGENARKVEAVLDEMCHLLAIQTTPTRKLKWTGALFMKCITRIYSNIYVNTHLSPMAQLEMGPDPGLEMFKSQFLKLSNKMPVVVLPTHRSYMDFLFITYVMFLNELPLPIVAAGDNFKALGSVLTNYLKATGAFLIRRNASNKRDIGANDYYDILRAYVHSVVAGGENPIEFFMEGTRTRLGQVLRPKTGLLSMVVDMYLDGMVDDICILPATINYQRPIEEQLYINEMTPQISKSKPKETAKNLIAAFDRIMKRRYGKVYVRFLEPFKLSDFHQQWSQRAKSTGTPDTDSASSDKSAVLHDLTNSLATKVCLAQANGNVLMPFNLITFSILARSFMSGPRNGQLNADDMPITIEIPIQEVTQDFVVLEELLKRTVPNFEPGWRGHLDILSEFKLDRDGLFRASEDRKMIQFDYDARTFHTFSYYANQVMQILLPIAISSSADSLDRYRQVRSMLAREFLIDDMSLESEYSYSAECLQKGLVCETAKNLIHKHRVYLLRSYLIFLRYLQGVEILVKGEFFHKTTSESQQFISKDMLNNMMNLVKDLKICRSVTEEDPKYRPSSTGKSRRPEEQLEVQSKEKLADLISQFECISEQLSV